jgi:hypothetical protein
MRFNDPNGAMEVHLDVLSGPDVFYSTTTHCWSEASEATPLDATFAPTPEFCHPFDVIRSTCICKHGRNMEKHCQVKNILAAKLRYLRSFQQIRRVKHRKVDACIID